MSGKPMVPLIPELTEEQKEKCLDIMLDAIDLLAGARPKLTTDEILLVIERQYRHPAAGDTGLELGKFADEVLGLGAHSLAEDEE